MALRRVFLKKKNLALGSDVRVRLKRLPDWVSQQGGSVKVRRIRKKRGGESN